jgi:hypothetical protein
MSKLLDLVGTHVASDAARAVIALFPDLGAEVEDLGPNSGVPPAHYLRSEDDGLLIKCSPEGEILAIFLMSQGKDGFEQFAGELPGHLTFESTPRDALAAFGEPAYRRPPSRIGSTQIGELLRFDYPDRSVHFLFRSGGAGIDLVTVMAARAVPGRRHHGAPS